MAESVFEKHNLTPEVIGEETQEFLKHIMIPNEGAEALIRQFEDAARNFLTVLKKKEFKEEGKVTISEYELKTFLAGMLVGEIATSSLIGLADKLNEYESA